MNRFGTLGFLMSVAFMSAGCGPVMTERWAEIGPSQTAFRLPLESEEKSEQFGTAQYLAQKKIAMSRYVIPQRRVDTGWFWYSYKYVPTELVVVVDRAPVTKSWTFDGSGAGVQAISLESVESIGFRLGITLTAAVEEQDANVYLYTFGGYTYDADGKRVPYTSVGGTNDDPSLEHVLDTNVHGWVQQKLSHDLGSVPIDKLDERLSGAIDDCYKEAKAFFKTQGITIQSLGLAAGVRFENDKIQEVIDKRFTAANDIEVAKRESTTQDQVNQRMLSKTRADIDTANKRAAARDAVLLQAQLNLAKVNAEAFQIAAEGWDGNPAHLVPQGGLFLFGLDGSFGTPPQDFQNAVRPAGPAPTP